MSEESNEPGTSESFERTWWFCPQCKRTMRPHCSSSAYCSWVFCGVCAIIKGTTGARRHFKMFRDEGWES